MRTALVLLILLIILFVWTAVRYRKQITSILGVIRMIREAAVPVGNRGEVKEIKTSVPNELVSCSKCGVWVPHDRAIRFDAKTYYCSKDCVAASLAKN